MTIEVDDGLTFDIHATTVEAIRQDDIYPGVRVNTGGTLSSAKIRFHIDINIGDELWPKPDQLELPRLLGNSPIRVLDYSAELILAEKIVTAIQRGTANTRWRDFVDIASLADTAIDNDILTEAIQRVADQRLTRIRALSVVLEGFGTVAQPQWSAWRRKQQLAGTPESFAELLNAVIEFSDQHLNTNDNETS